MSEGWALVGNLVVAVVHPLLLAGAAFGGMYLAVYGPGYDSAAVIVLFLLTGLLWMTSIFLGALPGATFAGTLALTVMLIALFVSIESAVLTERGRHTTCDVLGVDRRTETTTSYSSNYGVGGTGGGTTTTTRTYYDHHLRCDDGPIDTMTWPSAVAQRGQRLAVVYDPDDRVEPVPADTMTDGSTSRLVAIIALCASVVLRVGGVLLDDDW